MIRVNFAQEKIIETINSLTVLSKNFSELSKEPSNEKIEEVLTDISDLAKKYNSMLDALENSIKSLEETEEIEINVNPEEDGIPLT